jgi:acyl-CoA thioester hydrolase
MNEKPDAPVSGPRPTSRPPVEGTTRVRVRYCECDPMGVAHHAAYIPWLEIGRTELLRACGVSYAEMERAGVFLVITNLRARYRRPSLYDDLVEVRTRVAQTGRVKIEHEYEVVLAERPSRGEKAASATVGEVLCSASSTLACVDGTGRVRELPDWLRAD